MNKILMRQRIENAQKEIDSKKMIVQNGKMRQHYHFMPQSGWMNDPNGLIFFNGQYHVFYQTNPYNGFWDCMHWGHAVSKDFVHWEYLPLALAPSEEYDDYQKGGCFSGSAIEHEGKLYVFYTATANHGNGSEQSQCLAISEDGINFEKYDGNPLFDAPEGIQPDSFRDPKVWKHENKYYMVVGASRNNRGLALIYESADLYHWNFLNVLAESRGEWGFMWECPDFYQLGDKYVLTFSPMGSGDHTSVYLTGDFDYKTGKFDWHISGEMDWGFDFYAPQTTLLPDGRRVMIAWMKSWDSCVIKEKQRWQGMMTLPRELEYRDGKIWQKPVREIENYRKNRCCYENVKVGESLSLEGVRGRMIDLTVELQNADGIMDGSRNSGNPNQEALDVYNEFRIELARNEEYTTVFTYDRKRQILEIDRTWSGVQRDVVCTRKLQITDDRQNLKLRFILDRSSIELFINDGSKTATTVIPTPVEADEILFHSDGNAVIQVEKYDIVL